MTQTTKFLGSCWQVTAAVAPGETATMLVPSTGFPTIQLTVPAGQSLTIFGSCSDSVVNVSEDAFPLIGEDGAVPATAHKRTVCVPFPGPLRAVYVLAAAENTVAVSAVILQ